MTKQAPKIAASGRTLRRLRASFRRELLGDAEPTPSDQALIDLAAQAALRVREMRAEITAGNRVPDEDLVRISNAVNRIMREFRDRATVKADDGQDWGKIQEEADRLEQERRRAQASESEGA